MPYLVYHSPPAYLSKHRLDCRISVGEYTYFDQVITFAMWRNDDEVTIGNFCSIAKGCMIFAGGNHYTERATTYPFQAFGVGGDRAFDVHEWAAPSANTSIGHDVWLAQGVRIMPGAQVGNGCVIGAGAVVVGGLPPYSVAAGNPAAVVRKRFSDCTIERLLDVAWWDWPVARVLANVDLLMSSPETWPDPLELADEAAFAGKTLPISSPLMERIARRIAALRRQARAD